MSEGRLGAHVGETEIGSGWRSFFWAAALFNFVIGGSAMLSPSASMDARITGLMIFAFGVIYMLVARDPARFGSTLWAGVIGKVGVVALLAPGQLGEGGNIWMVLILGVDALFALGFLAFLLLKSDEA